MKKILILLLVLILGLTGCGGSGSESDGKVASEKKGGLGLKKKSIKNADGSINVDNLGALDAGFYDIDLKEVSEWTDEYKVLLQNGSGEGDKSFSEIGEELNASIVVLPNDIEYIYGDSFLECEWLQYVYMPDNITSTGIYAFEKSGLKGIRLSRGLRELEDYMFKDCSELIEIEIPNNIETIGEFCFLGCEALKEVNIPNSITYMCEGVFYKCTSLETANIPKSLTAIPEGTFASCTSLKNVTLHDEINYVGACAFEDCTSLSKIDLSDNVTQIRPSAFSGCESLEHIELPSNLTFIGYCAFKGCGLKTLNLPNGLETIEYSAFEDNYLESLIVPASVKTVDAKCFRYNRLLKTAVFEKGDELTLGNSVFAVCEALERIEIPQHASVTEETFGACNAQVISY